MSERIFSGTVVNVTPIADDKYQAPGPTEETTSFLILPFFYSIPVGASAVESPDERTPYPTNAAVADVTDY